MAGDEGFRVEVERNIAWRRSWPRCFIGLMATFLIIDTLVILLTDLANILIDFWHTNIFGGCWTSIVLFINIISLYSAVCCGVSLAASTCAFIWNIFTLLTVSALIVIDAIFITNPTACFLTPSCSTQTSWISLLSFFHMIPGFQNYTTYESKKVILEIQIGCAGAAFLVSFIYIITYITSKTRMERCVVHNYPAPAAAPPPPPQQPLPPPPPIHHIYPVVELPHGQWAMPTPNAPYASY